jgi:hypothetical protein
VSEPRGGELTIALGPAGAAGLVSMALGLLRRSPVLFAVGLAAVAADAGVPALRGLAAARQPRARAAE